MVNFGKKDQRTDMIRFLPKSYSKTLEIGCNTGGFSENLMKGCEIWGVEPNQLAAKIAQQKMSNVLVGRYEDIQGHLPNDYFDLIICNDVIEHFTNHDDFFQSIKTKLSTNGVLIASVPNVRHVANLFELLVKKDWRYQDYGTLDRTHLRFFTAKSLLRTLKEHQFEIEDFQGINSCIRKYAMIGNAESVAIAFMVSLAVALTFGYYWDIQYLQYGFRVKKNKT